MNTMDDADDPLLPLAEKIAEGAPVDPEEESRLAAEDTDPGVLRALLDIAVVEAAHRNAERDFDQSHQNVHGIPRQWAHLTILETIGHGEFGEVYRAHDSRLQIDVALKLSPADDEASRVLDEARLLARVRHENVVRVHGADHRDGRVGLWMDLVPGRTLEDLTRTQGFGASEAINIGIELCRGLAAVHLVGVLHGDIKAHNVIRRDGGRIVLVDFGGGRPLADQPAEGSDLIGTPVYMAPEVLEDQPRSVASDIYSLGVLLFHLVTGAYPVYASSRAALIEAHHNGSRKQLRDLRPELPDGFIQIVERATAVNPRSRFASAGALEAALVNLVAPSAPTPAPGGRRQGWRTAAAGLGAVVLVVIGVLALRAGDRSPTPSVEAPPVTNPVPPGNERPAGSYDIEAVFYRVDGNGTAQRLSGESRLRVNDQIHLSVQTSSPTYLYVVNEDENGAAFLLYPPRDRADANPLRPNAPLRLPEEQNWVVNSSGSKEHFLVFASTEPLTAFEEQFRKLSAPQSEGLPPGALDSLRGVGGLTPAAPQQGVPRYRDIFPTPLTGRETATGMWVRQLTVENVGK